MVDLGATSDVAWRYFTFRNANPDTAEVRALGGGLYEFYRTVGGNLVKDTTITPAQIRSVSVPTATATKSSYDDTRDAPRLTAFRLLEARVAALEARVP